MLAAIVEFTAGLLYGTGELATESRRGRRLVVVAMAVVLVGLVALAAYLLLG